MAGVPTYKGPTYNGYGVSDGGTVNSDMATYGNNPPYNPQQAMANYQALLGGNMPTSFGSANTLQNHTNIAAPLANALMTATMIYGPKNAAKDLSAWYKAKTAASENNTSAVAPEGTVQTSPVASPPPTEVTPLGGGETAPASTPAAAAPASEGATADSAGEIKYTHDAFQGIDKADEAATNPNAYAGVDSAADPYVAVDGASSAEGMGGSAAGAGGAADAEAAGEGAVDYTGTDLAAASATDYAAADAAAAEGADAAAADSIGAYIADGAELLA